jgi:hypothetical protein
MGAVQQLLRSVDLRRGPEPSEAEGADGVGEVVSQDRLAVLEALRAKVQPLVGAGEALLAIREDLQALLPWGGLKRGSTLTIDCPSLLLATVGAATSEGSWVAFVGVPTLGFAAASEHGVVLERTVAVVAPPFDQAAVVVASLVDAVDLVVVGPGVITRSSDARRLTARARERGSVLIAMGVWPEAVDVGLRVTGSSFTGLGDGHGHIQSWSATVEATGRGAAARRRQANIVLCSEVVGSEVVPMATMPTERIVTEDAGPKPSRVKRIAQLVDLANPVNAENSTLPFELAVAKAG